jgi:tripartite-type tricarboxylate transporter receptor subunit TctC
MRNFRLPATATALLVGLFGLVQGATAQGYPTAPVKLISPFAAGSPTDAVARVVANHLGKRLNQPVLVENKPGATGMLGTDFVAKSQADGYTILFGSNTTQVANQFLFKKMPYAAFPMHWSLRRPCLSTPSMN